MTCQSKEDAMDIDVSKSTNGYCTVIKKNGLLLYPVIPQVAGEGLPYAPINWPNPGDTWSWRVGKRTSVSGYYLDRYLYPPSRLQKTRRGKESFKSKLSVQEYIQALCPNADVNAFFASFSWKIPSKQAFLIKEHHDASCMLSEEMTEQSLSDGDNGDLACKAGNRFCRSLTEEANVNTMFCDICCIEANFCRDCCCILCCKTVDLAFGGYSFIRCKAEVHDGLVCGHSAHLVCALRCYLAGTIGGTIGLDAEYYCRRCDSRSGLIEHVTEIFKTCKSVESPSDVKKILDLIVCLTRGSQKSDAKRLMNRAQCALQKLECGNVVSNIWEAEDDITTVNTVEDTHDAGDLRRQTPAAPVGIQKERCKLNDEIEQILEELKSSQRHELKVTQRTLLAQRDLLLQLHQKLDSDKSKLAQQSSSARLHGVSSIAQTEKKIKRETKTFRQMAKVAMGFGNMPRDILYEYFDLETDD